MKKAIVLAFAMLATSLLAATAQGSQSAAVKYSAAGYSCSKTITLPLVTPITGGAGFLGAEQSSWAKLAPRQRRRPPPKGIQVYVPGDCSRKRSGRNSYGFG